MVILYNSSPSAVPECVSSTYTYPDTPDLSHTVFPDDANIFGAYTDIPANLMAVGSGSWIRSSTSFTDAVIQLTLGTDPTGAAATAFTQVRAFCGGPLPNSCAFNMPPGAFQIGCPTFSTIRRYIYKKFIPTDGAGGYSIFVGSMTASVALSNICSTVVHDCWRPAYTVRRSQVRALCLGLQPGNNYQVDFNFLSSLGNPGNQQLVFAATGFQEYTPYYDIPDATLNESWQLQNVTIVQV